MPLSNDWVRRVAFLGCLVFLIGLELSDWVTLSTRESVMSTISCCHSHEWIISGAQLEGPPRPLCSSGGWGS